jgi:hypothetical protein
MSPEPIASHSVAGAVIRVRIELVRKAEAIEERPEALVDDLHAGGLIRLTSHPTSPEREQAHHYLLRQR